MVYNLVISKRNFNRFKNAKVINVGFSESWENNEGTVWLDFDNGLRLELGTEQFYPSVEIFKLNLKGEK